MGCIVKFVVECVYLSVVISVFCISRFACCLQRLYELADASGACGVCYCGGSSERSFSGRINDNKLYNSMTMNCCVSLD